MNIYEASKKFEKFRLPSWPKIKFIERSIDFFKDNYSDRYVISYREVLSEKWEEFKEEPTILYEIKKCDFWRDGYEFLETANGDGKFYQFGRDREYIHDHNKYFRGYVCRGMKGLYINEMCNVWESECGATQLVPYTKEHVKLEPLGVLVER